MSRWLSVDPGDTVGWALWEDREDGTALIDGGQTPDWEFVHMVADGLGVGASWKQSDDNGNEVWIAKGPHGPFANIQRLVVEDFLLYPKNIGPGPPPAWDALNTPRVIGALTYQAREAQIPLVFQGAKIKSAAEAAGAEELFARPLHEQRHHNDSLRHGVHDIVVTRGRKVVG